MTKQTNTIRANQKKIIIIAGNRVEFENYLRQRRLNRFEYVHGYCAEVLAGVEAKNVITIGTWYVKDSNHNLLKLAKASILKTQCLVNF